ncbi:serine hydrolase [Pseudofrankia asymbiotica]|nr:serine hydrolase [Pseudofrankia asymbiotica]
MSADDLQTRVQTAIDRMVRDGTEVGLQVAVVRHGHLVVDAVAGLRDAESRLPVLPDTLFYVASAAKGVAAATAHVLVERGVLTDDLRIADVWPEFGVHGKQDATLRHVLLHTVGVPAPPYDTTVEELCDWDHMCAALADARPWWVPGTRFGYHAQTFGFLLGETVRRASGRPLSWWLREAVTTPLGIEDDVRFGVRADLLGRVAHQHRPPGPTPEPPKAGSPADRAVPPGIRPDAGLANRRDVLTADIISSGTMTARGAARVYAALLGDVAGRAATGAAGGLVSPARLAAMAALTHDGQDEVMGMPTTWAFGFSPYRPGGVASRPGSTFGMIGSNGSAAYADIDSGVAVAVTRNRFSQDLSAAAEIDRIVADAFPSSANSRTSAGPRTSASPHAPTTDHRPPTMGATMDDPVTELDERFSDPGAQPTTWAATLEILETAQLSWISTVRADGRPHVTPLVAVWLDGALHFSTGPSEQKAVNLATNPNVVLATGSASWDQGTDVMVEGEAVRVTDRELLTRLADAWRARWDGGWRFDVADDGFHHEGGGPAFVFAVRPTKILAFGKGTFTHTRHLPQAR